MHFLGTKTGWPTVIPEVFLSVCDRLYIGRHSLRTEFNKCCPSLKNIERGCKEAIVPTCHSSDLLIVVKDLKSHNVTSLQTFLVKLTSYVFFGTSYTFPLQKLLRIVTTPVWIHAHHTMSGFFHCLVSLPSVNIDSDTGALFLPHLCTGVHLLVIQGAWHVKSCWINGLPSLYARLSAEHQRQIKRWLPEKLILTGRIFLVWAERLTAGKEECCQTVTFLTWEWTDTNVKCLRESNN